MVGSGSGLDVAGVAANRGQSVAVVEKGPLGGTCLNRGCIPSKQLLYHAEVRETIDRADEFHMDVDGVDVDFAGMVREVTDTVSGNAESIRRGVTDSDRHTLFEGEGRFVDERTVEIAEGPDEGARFRAETVLIAAGTQPAIPDIDGIEDVDYLTSTGALKLESPPDHLVIVGGGYIAAELGHFFGTFGSDVTIVGRRPRLLPEADEEVAAAFTGRFADRFTVHTGHAATAVSENDGQVTVEALPYEYREGGETGAASDGGIVDDADPVTVTGGSLLVAAGRVPNSDTLNLDAAGVETDGEGFIETDEYFRTTADGVWALGDIVGEYLLKHSANHGARAAVRNIFSQDPQPVDYSAMPFAVFAAPEVAGVGATEQDLRAAGREYATNTHSYQGSARGQAMHAEGFVTVIAGPDDELLGCHIVGPDASSILQEAVLSMTAGSGTVQDVRDTIHIHPALPEVVQRAFSGRFTPPGDGHAHHHE